MIQHTNEGHSRSSSVALLTVGMVMSGTIGYFVVESGVTPVLVVFWRCLLGAVALLAITAVQPQARRQLRETVLSRAGLAVALSGALLILNWILIFTAYEHLSIGVATVIFHVEPFILIGLGAIFLNERLSKRTVAWAVLGFFGIVLVAKPWTATSTEIGSLAFGVALTLIAATLYAGSIVVVRREQAHPNGSPSPLVIVTIQLITGAVITAPALLFVPQTITPAGWGHIAILGLVNTALMYRIIYAAYPRLGTATIGVLAFVYPAAAVVVDLLAYGIAITLPQLLGFGAIAGAGIGQIITDKNAAGPQQQVAKANNPHPRKTTRPQ